MEGFKLHTKPHECIYSQTVQQLITIHACVCHYAGVHKLKFNTTIIMHTIDGYNDVCIIINCLLELNNEPQHYRSCHWLTNSLP